MNNDEFIENIYEGMEEQLKDTYKKKKESRDELLKAIAMIMLTYTVLNDVLSLSKSDYDKQYNLLSTLIIKLTKDDIGQETSNIRNILGNVVENTYNQYSYNHNLKDVEKIINDNFKGKHFSSRVWDNEQEVAKKLTKQCQDFLQGKINVNQIANEIKNTYNTSAYNAKRLTETEVARCQNKAFDRFCKEVGVKKVIYRATLCNSCDECLSHDGKIYNFNNKPKLPRHPMCRCYYDIADDSNLEQYNVGSANKERYKAKRKEWSNERNRIHRIGEFENDDSHIDILEDEKGVQEWVDRALSIGVGTIDIKHIKNVEVLNPLLDELEELKDEYGKVFNRIESIDLKENTIAQLNGRVLQLNQRYFNDKDILKKQLNKWSKDKYIPANCNNIRYVITHEYMHLLTQDEIDNPISKVHSIFRRAKDKEFVSRYSSINCYEFVAELLSANRLNGISNKSIKSLLKIFGR